MHLVESVSLSSKRGTRWWLILPRINKINMKKVFEWTWRWLIIERRREEDEAQGQRGEKSWSNYDDNDGGYNGTEKHNGDYNEDNDKALFAALVLENIYTHSYRNGNFLFIVIIIVIFLLVEMDICRFLSQFKLD